jgi:uncharacterized protein (DUF983 family)
VADKDQAHLEARVAEKGINAMSSNEFVSETEALEERANWPAMMKGLRGKCPSCGETALFTKGLKVQDQCSVCDEEFHHHRADDLPAYLNIFVVGHVVVALIMIALKWDIVSMWTGMFITIAIAILVSVLMMRPLKGMVVGAQWAMRMHGFGGNED